MRNGEITYRRPRIAIRGFLYAFYEAGVVKWLIGRLDHSVWESWALVKAPEIRRTGPPAGPVYWMLYE